MTPQKFNYEVLIREHHLDTFGHVNNAVYLQLFEEARWEILYQNGIRMEEIHESGTGPTLLEARLLFRRELRLRQKIRIESYWDMFRSKIGRMKQTIYNDQNQPCCEAVMVIGIFDLRARKLIEPTPLWRKAVAIPSQ